MTIDDQLKTVLANQPYPILMATISGAHSYGFPSADSDYDIRGLHVVPLHDIIGLYPAKETIGKNRIIDGLEIDLVTHDVHMFCLLLLKKNGNIIEQIYSPLVLATSPEHDELKAIAKGCITRHHVHHYMGFSKKKWEEFAQRTPKHAKTLLYVYRVLLTGIHLMQTGECEANLVTLNEKFNLPYVPELIARKHEGGEKSNLPEADVDFHFGEFKRLSDELLTANENTHLPDNPTSKHALNDWLIRIRLQYSQDHQAE